jgi:peptidoglycan hydrolase CwlO-like protein
MQWLLPSIITAVATLLIAFGALYFNRRSQQQDKAAEGVAQTSAAKLGSEATLLGLLLDRIENLEARLDKNLQRSQERQAKIEQLKTERNQCKAELAALVQSHETLKDAFEKKLKHLTNGL